MENSLGMLGLMKILPEWMAESLQNEHITDICINGTESVFIDRGEGMRQVEIEAADRLTEAQLRDWVLRELASVGKSWDAKCPFVDATLPSGHRMHVIFPPLSQNGILVSFRRLPRMKSTIQATKSGRVRWASSSRYYSMVREAIVQADSILIVGATGSGKTTLASDLLEEVDENERIIALEDTPELAPCHPHFISLLSRNANADGFGEVTLRTLLRQTLRMRPDRVILGECRGGEVMELLQALNTGHRGALATIHANSAKDALMRIELLCLLNQPIPITVIRGLIANGIRWIVHVAREGGSRKIREVCRIEGKEGDTILLRPM